MSTVIDELILKLKWEAETGDIKLTEQEIQKLKTAFGQAATEEEKLEKKITSASLAFDRKARAVNNSRDAIVRATSSFSGFGGTLGQVGNQIFNVTNQVEDLEFASKRAGKEINVFNDSIGNSTSALGKLGTASLIVSAAMAGWKLGSMINQIDGVAQAVERLWTRLMELDPVLNQIAKQNNAIVTEESVAALKAQTDSLNIKLFQQYAETIDSAGKSVTQYNKEVLAALKSHRDFANTTDQVVNVIAKMPPVVNATTKSLDSLTKQVVKTDDVFEQWFNLINDGILNINGAMGQAEIVEPFKEGLEIIGQYPSILDQAAQSGINFSGTLGQIEVGTEKIGVNLQSIADFFGQLASNLGGLGGLFSGSISNAVNAFKDLKINQDLAFGGGKVTMANKWAGGIGAAFSTLGQNVDGVKGRILSAIGAIATGFAEGGPLGAAIAAIGVAINEIFRAFQHDWVEDVQHQMNHLIAGLQVSAELTEKIAASAKELGDSEKAVLLAFSDIVAELGVTETNISQLLMAARNLFVGIGTGAITAAEAAGELNDTFAQLAEVADKMGGAASAQLTELINLTRQFGLEVQAVTDYVNKQIQIVVDSTNTLATSLKAAMDAIVPGGPVPITTLPNIGRGGPIVDFSGDLGKVKSQFDTLLSLVSAGIKQLTLNGGELDDIFAQFGGQLDVLAEAAKRFGFNLGGSLRDLIQLGNAVEGKLGDMITVTRAVGDAMGALGKLGVKPTALEFDKFGDSVDKVFKRIVKATGNEDLALAEIAPQLKIIAQLQEQFGLKVDKSTQALLDEARAAGLLEPDPMEQMVDAANRLADGVEKLVDLFGGATNAADSFSAALNAIPSDIDVNVNTNYTSSGKFGSNPGGGGIIPQSSSFSGSSATQTQQTIILQTTHYVVLDGKVIDKYITESMESGTIAPAVTRTRLRASA